ncbi:MAG: 2-phospho-L-lactate transferase [Candidatus Hadarchaeales archaeon]
MITVLSGGTGTPKLIQGLTKIVDQRNLRIIVNTGEDTEISGLYVSPDIDTVVYTLAGIVNEETWYGISGDTFSCYEMLKVLGEKELLRIGDKDRAVKLYRTLKMREGWSLSRITGEICRTLGVKAIVLPMSDDRVRTVIHTEEGDLSFHEFWVARRANVNVKNVTFENLENARPAPGVLEAIDESSLVIIGPSNPVTSIGPIIGVREIGKKLMKNREKVVAVSPIIGNAPVSGPAGILMKALKYEVNPVGVAKIYRQFIKTIFVDKSDHYLAPEIERLGISVESADLFLPDIESRERLARKILEYLNERSS